MGTILLGTTLLATQTRTLTYLMVTEIELVTLENDEETMTTMTSTALLNSLSATEKSSKNALLRMSVAGLFFPRGVTTEAMEAPEAFENGGELVEDSVRDARKRRIKQSLGKKKKEEEELRLPSSVWAVVTLVNLCF